jgi:predicted amidophosphoribosyltransferase
MLHALWAGCLGLISTPRCAACGGVAPEPPAPALCLGCLQRLNLPAGGLAGDQPLPWRALGAYGGPLRQLLLGQRPQPDPALIRALAAALLHCRTAALAGSLVVPIPSWKQRGNPLPPQLAAALVAQAGGRCCLASGLLQRNRAAVGQHHLNRRQRLGNQGGSFHVAACGRARLWLVDDILTTGATALAAAASLQARGWVVQGLLCAARTPGPSPP